MRDALEFGAGEKVTRRGWVADSPGLARGRPLGQGVAACLAISSNERIRSSMS
jgi:hypothetical protein